MQKGAFELKVYPAPVREIQMGNMNELQNSFFSIMKPLNMAFSRKRLNLKSLFLIVSLLPNELKDYMSLYDFSNPYKLIKGILSKPFRERQKCIFIKAKQVCFS